MSYCKEIGKDRVTFVTRDEHEVPSKVSLPERDPKEPPAGLILPNGDINWNCPCLGGMASGPCGVQFRDAFSCFHYSESDPKGSECVERFQQMQICMNEYPNLYPTRDKQHDHDEDDDFDDDDLKQEVEKRLMEMDVDTRNGDGSDKHENHKNTKESN